MIDLHEYAFDVKVDAVVRVRAAGLEEAHRLLDQIKDFQAGDAAQADCPVRLTEFSFNRDFDTTPDPGLFEVDGERVEGEDDICDSCGGPNADGEGYDGYCGNCADAADAAGKWGPPSAEEPEPDDAVPHVNHPIPTQQGSPT